MEGFLTLTEFPIALAGFTGIVVVFVHQNKEWDTFDKFRIGNALWSSIGAAFLASIPTGLFYLEIEEPTVWFTEALIIGVYIVFILVAVTIRRKTMLTPEQDKKLPQKYVMSIFAAGILIVMLILLSLMGMLSIPLKGLAYFSLIYLLIIAVFAFSRIIFYRPD